MAAMPRFVRAFGGAAFAQGGAFCSDEYAGAALWLRPGVHPDEERLVELMESTASPDAREAGDAIFEQMAKYHPEEVHWYLPLIGVDPAHQRRGHGDAVRAMGSNPGLFAISAIRRRLPTLPTFEPPPLRSVRKRP